MQWFHPVGSAAVGAEPRQRPGIRREPSVQRWTGRCWGPWAQEIFATWRVGTVSCTYKTFKSYLTTQDLDLSALKDE